MIDRDNGGPAFPPVVMDAPGMSLRDWFAGQALSGLLADPNVRSTDGLFEHVAASAYIFADAMIAARARAGK